MKVSSAAGQRRSSGQYFAGVDQVGELPGGWGFHTMWQYTSTGPTVGDHNRFNGALDRVQALANG